MPLDDAIAARLSRPIRIRSVEAISVALPLTKPMKMAGVEIRTADNLVVRIEAEDGTCGWGEAASAPTMTGDTLPAMVAAVRDVLMPLVEGQDARGRARLVAKMAHALHANTGARSAVETALDDLVGRTLGVGFADLHGGAVRDAVEPMWLIGNPTVEEDIAEAKARMADGYAFFKLKVGVKRVEQEIETAIAMRKAVGPDVTLCADANGGFDYQRAAKFLAGVGPAGLAFLEQPLPPENLAGLARLVRSTALPLGADEGIHSLSDIEALHEGQKRVQAILHATNHVQACGAISQFTREGALPHIHADADQGSRFARLHQHAGHLTRRAARPRAQQIVGPLQAKSRGLAHGNAVARGLRHGHRGSHRQTLGILPLHHEGDGDAIVGGVGPRVAQATATRGLSACGDQ